MKCRIIGLAGKIHREEMLRRIHVDDIGYGRRKFSEDQEDDRPKLLHRNNALNNVTLRIMGLASSSTGNASFSGADEPFTPGLPCLDQA
jgi:hypothetical protein